METQNRAELCFPHLSNTSCRKPPYSLPELVLLRVTLSSITVITVALNLLVIISVSHYRQLHTPTNILLLSLAVSDFLMGLLIIPREIISHTGCWFLGDLMCSLSNYVAYIISSASVGDMVLISVDRYVAICDPLNYQTRVTEKRVKVCVCLCWLCSALYNVLLIKAEISEQGRQNSCDGECIFVYDNVTELVDLILTFIAPVSVITVLYMKVFVVAVSQARVMRAHVTATKLQISVSRTRKSELKAARNLGVLIVMFLICFIPYHSVSIAEANSPDSTTSIFVYYLFRLNSTLNPVIYSLFYPWFRKSVKFTLTLRILQPGSHLAKML